MGFLAKTFMITRIYIHAGTFHADDVMSVSIVRLLNPAVQYDRIIRVTELDDVYAEEKEIVSDFFNDTATTEIYT